MAHSVLTANRRSSRNSLGMKVGTDTTPAKGLRKGLYIMNGRKVIIR